MILKISGVKNLLVLLNLEGHKTVSFKVAVVFGNFKHFNHAIAPPQLEPEPAVQP